MKSSEPYTLIKNPARFTVVDLLHDFQAMGMDEDIIIKSYGEKSRHTDPPSCFGHMRPYLSPPRATLAFRAHAPVP